MQYINTYYAESEEHIKICLELNNACVRDKTEYIINTDIIDCIEQHKDSISITGYLTSIHLKNGSIIRVSNTLYDIRDQLERNHKND